MKGEIFFMTIQENMTQEEYVVLEKLKAEILNAVSIADLLFYKEEMDRINRDIRKRREVLKQSMREKI